MKLSIITINYNHLDGLKKTYNSVVCQTWKDYEWIIIDGRSTDGSREFIEEHQKEFSYWCSEPDNGVYNAMNKGILKAQGEYLIFMNSGDTFASPTILDEIFMEKYSEDVIYGYMMRRTLDGVPNNQGMMKPVLYWYDFYYESLPHQASFLKKELFEKYGLYNESYRICGDWEFNIRTIIKNGASYKFIPKKIAIYECDGISDGNISELKKIQSEFPPYLAADAKILKTYRRLQRWKIFRMGIWMYKAYSSWRQS